MMTFRFVAAALVLSAGFWGSFVQFLGFGNDHDKKPWWHHPFTPTIEIPEETLLFGQDQLSIDDDNNILSGTAATNSRATLGRDTYIEGTLLADRAHIGEGTTIVGDLEADRIEGQNYTVLGETRSRTTKNYEFPDVPRTERGHDRVSIGKNETATIQPGTYRTLSIGNGATVTLQPGQYDVQRFFIGRDATLSITEQTVVDVGKHLFVGSGVMVDLATNLEPSDLTWNYTGHGTLTIGKNVFGAGNIFSPKAAIHVSKDTTWRGRLLGKKLTLKDRVVVSAQTTSTYVPNTADIVVTDEGAAFPMNIVLVNVADAATAEDIAEIVAAVDGRIVGQIPSIELYQVLVPATTEAELRAAIQEMIDAGGVLIESAKPDYLLNLD